MTLNKMKIYKLEDICHKEIQNKDTHQIVTQYSCNFRVFDKMIIGNKFDLFWTTTLFLQLQ